MFGLIRRNQDMYDPFRQMEEFRKAFFAEPFGGLFGANTLSQFRTDVTDEGDHYLLEADLPGFDKKDITLDIHDRILTVRAQRSAKVEQTDNNDKVIRRERTYGVYERSFDISGVDADQIKAKYTDGVLRLTMPKQDKPAGRRLEIE